MLKGKDIVIVGQQAWDVEIGSNCKNIALELSKYNRVLYVNSPLDRITKIRSYKDFKIRKRINVIQGREVGLLKIRENLWVFYPDVLIESINWIRVNSIFSYLNKINNKKFAMAIQKPIIKLQFTNFLLFNDNDIFRSFHLKELLKPIISIYYLRDNMIATSYWKRHGKVLEPKLIKKSDIVFSNSEYLRKYSQKYNENSYFVGQGCELELIDNTDISIIPNDLKDISYPIIGYIGALTSLRLDLALIFSLATTMSQCNFVLIGAEDDNFKKSKLHNLKNVFFLGAKRTELLFQYINAFDVCINPQAVNELTVGNYPRKIDEYLALGKPVVATMTETMLTFKDYVYLANNRVEFREMIETALRLNNSNLEKKRVEFAFSHNWKSSVDKMSKIVQERLLVVNDNFNKK